MTNHPAAEPLPPPRRPGTTYRIAVVCLGNICRSPMADVTLNQRLADAVSAEVRLGLAKVDRIRRNSSDQVASHRALVNLLERGDVEAAARELEDHLEHAETSMLTALRLPSSS